jgi:tetratricopeptide (TPR) repeat protein
MVGRAIALALCVASVAPGAAMAQDNRIEQAKQQVAAADIDYRLARFTEALAEYTRAYELYPVPALLFNIGQCHRNLKAYGKAIFFFEGYLRDAPRATNRALVEDLIRESKAELAKAELAKAPPAAPPAAPVEPSVRVPPPAPAEPMPRPAAAVAMPRNEAPTPDRAPSHGTLVPGLLVGGGFAAAAAGVVFYYYGQKRGPEEMFTYDDTRPLGGALVVVGGAAIITGAVLWARHRSAPVAAVSSTSGYVGWAGAF